MFLVALRFSLCLQVERAGASYQGPLSDAGIQVPLQRANAGPDPAGQFPHRPTRTQLRTHLLETHQPQPGRR